MAHTRALRQFFVDRVSYIYESMYGPRKKLNIIREASHCHLKINDDKTEFLVMTKPHLVPHLKNLKMEIGAHLVPVSKDAKKLGVYFYSTLSMRKQINCVSTQCYTISAILAL